MIRLSLSLGFLMAPTLGQTSMILRPPWHLSKKSYWLGGLKEFITDTGLMHHKSSMLSSIPLFYLVVLEGSFSDPKMVKQDKEITPKTINDVKLINAGKILENNQTLAESRVPVGELPGGVITMHVVVRPPQLDKNNEKQQGDARKQNRCTCTIL